MLRQMTNERWRQRRVQNVNNKLNNCFRKSVWFVLCMRMCVFVVVCVAGDVWVSECLGREIKFWIAGGLAAANKNYAPEAAIMIMCCAQHMLPGNARFIISSFQSSYFFNIVSFALWLFGETAETRRNFLANNLHQNYSHFACFSIFCERSFPIVCFNFHVDRQMLRRNRFSIFAARNVKSSWIAGTKTSC